MRNARPPGSKWLSAVALLVCFAGSGSAADQVTSEYTKTTKGVVISKSKPTDETAFSSTRYKALGGYDLIVHRDDDRSWVDLQYGGKTVDLREATFKLSPGSFPNKANYVVEWRGVARQGEFAPFAIIYRIEATNEETRKSTSRLIVIVLNKLHSRVAGFAEGKNEDTDAKKLAARLKP